MVQSVVETDITKCDPFGHPYKIACIKDSHSNDPFMKPGPDYYSYIEYILPPRQKLEKESAYLPTLKPMK